MTAMHPRLPVEAFGLHGMHICLTCHALFGRCDRPTPQRCRCYKPEREQDIWPRHDFNLAFGLCRCCGAELLDSGSRYSVWFCGTCKRRVLELNGALGRCVVPVGRHSFHAGYLLRGGQVHDPVEVFTFFESMKGITGALDVVQQWAGEAVRRNLDGMGLHSDGDSVPLNNYLNGLRAHPPDKARRFEEMVGFLAEAGRTART